MDITVIIEKVPTSIKLDVIDYTPVKLKTGKTALRILIDRLLTDNEKKQLAAIGAIGTNCVAYYQYAPEIKKSYFYLEA